ncbi:MAG: tyrosine-protein phosphatase [bacterium]
MIDIHAHILPGFDDGAKSIEASLEMARGAEREGVADVVATPHVLEENQPDVREKICGAVADLNTVLNKERINVKVSPGAEVHISASLLSRAEILKDLSLNFGGRYVLLELPLQEVPKFTEELIFRVLLKRLTPILAHPERNLTIIENPGRLLGLVEKGALVQMNVGSITGRYGRRIKETAELFLHNGIVHFVASDAHSEENRPIRLRPAIERVKKLLGDAAADLVLDNATAALNGEKVEASVPRHLERPSKTMFSWLVRRI